MTVSDILDGAFKLMKANARSIVTIVAAVVVPLNLLLAFSQRTALGDAGFFSDAPQPATLDGELLLSSAGGVGGLVVSAVQLLVLPFLAGAVSVVVAGAYLGRDVGPGEAVSRVLRRGWALLLSWMLVKLVQFAGVILLVVAMVAVAAGGADEVVAGLLALAFVLPAGAVALVVMAYTVLVAPAIVVEELGPIEGIRRSIRLVRGRFWPVLGIALLSGILASALGFALSFVPSLGALASEEWGWILQFIGASLAQLVTVPIVSIVATLLYFDARIRREGFDLQVIAAELSGDRGPIS